MNFIKKSYKLHSDKIKAGMELSMVLISDLHLAEYGSDNVRLLEEIRKVHPDLIVSSGDLVTAKVEYDTKPAEHLLGRLAKEYPVYYVPGNHEERLKVKTEWFGNLYESYISRIKMAGVHYLYNQHEVFELHGVKLCIHGLALPLKYFQRMKRIELSLDEVNAYIGCPQKDCLNILLAHHPRYARTYFDWNADLILSGHVHGGVMRLGKQACISPDLSIFPRYGYGIFKKKKQSMIVSAGLGEHTIPFRVFNPKELVHIKIQAITNNGNGEKHGNTGKTAGV